MPSLASKVVSITMALVLVVTTATIDRHRLFAASAFSTPGRHHHHHHHSHDRLLLNRSKPNASTTTIAHHPTRRFVARHRQETTTTAAREDFQRSLLEAKIANDARYTIIRDERQRNIIVSRAMAQERGELRVAVNEVRDAVQDLLSQSGAIAGGQQDGGGVGVVDAAVGVSKSAINLGGAFVTTIPRIFARLFTLCATSETR